MYWKIYINVLLYLCLFQHLQLYKKKKISIQICKLGNAINAYEVCPCMLMYANEEMLAGYADSDASYPDADPDAT